MFDQLLNFSTASLKIEFSAPNLQLYYYVCGCHKYKSPFNLEVPEFKYSFIFYIR